MYVDLIYIEDGKILLLKRSVEPLRANLYVKVGGVINGYIEKTSDRTKISVAFEGSFAQGKLDLIPKIKDMDGSLMQVPSNSIYDYTYLKKCRELNLRQTGDLLICEAAYYCNF